MVELIIEKVRAEFKDNNFKEYIFEKGINIIKGPNSKGKTTLMGIIDYCFNGQFNSVFPWDKIEDKYYSVSIQIMFNSKKFVLRRQLKENRGKIIIYKGTYTNIIEELEIGIQEFFLNQINVKNSKISIGDKIHNISIRDYLKLFFSRQKDNRNIIGEDNTNLKKINYAGQILLGFEKEVLIKTQIDNENKTYKNKNEMLNKFKEHIGENFIEVDKKNLIQKERELENIKIELKKYEEEIFKSKNNKLPLEKEIFDLEKELRILKENYNNRELRIKDTNLLKNDIQLDFKIIREAEIALDVLGRYPEKKCPECNSENIEKDIIYCKLCGSKIEERKKEISNFYIINKNMKKELENNTLKLNTEKEEISNKISEIQKEYDNKLNQLALIEKYSIKRFTDKYKELDKNKGKLIEEIKELSIKLNFKEKVDLIKEENEKILNSIKNLEKELKEVTEIDNKIYLEYKNLFEKYLKIINTSYETITWSKNKKDLFPKINGKQIRDELGGSNAIRIVYSVLTSFFELSLKHSKKIVFPSIILIDSLKKHELKNDDLEAIGKEWERIIKEYSEGQIIITGVDIPNILQKYVKYEFDDKEFTL